jgi:hypothetical protein
MTEDLVFLRVLVEARKTKSVIDNYGQHPAQAAPVWLAIDTVRNGFGSGEL